MAYRIENTVTTGSQLRSYANNPESSWIRRRTRQFALPVLTTVIAGALGLWLQPHSEPVEAFDTQPQAHAGHRIAGHAATAYPYKDCLESGGTTVPAECVQGRE